MQITNDMTMCISPKCLMTEVGGEAVLMNIDNNTYFGLDPVGTDVLRHLKQPIRLSDLIALLRGEYDAPAATIETDTRALLEQLLDKGLVERAA